MWIANHYVDHDRLCNPFGSPLGWPSGWRYIVTTRESRRSTGTIRDGEVLDNQETSWCSPQYVWGPRDAAGSQTLPLRLCAAPVSRGMRFCPAVSVSEWACLFWQRKHIGFFLVEVAPEKAESHGRREADALALGDRPRRQDWCAENPRAHLGQPLQPTPDHGLFRERCRPKVAAADPHQSRMFLDAVRMRACIYKITWCCKRKVLKVLITWLVNVLRQKLRLDQCSIAIKSTHLWIVLLSLSSGW